MVSIRRQRLIKLYGRSPSLDFLPSFENGQSPGSWVQNTRQVSMLPTPSHDVDQSAEEKMKYEEPDSSNVNESSSSNKQPIQHPGLARIIGATNGVLQGWCFLPLRGAGLHGSYYMYQRCFAGLVLEHLAQITTISPRAEGLHGHSLCTD